MKKRLLSMVLGLGMFVSMFSFSFAQDIRSQAQILADILDMEVEEVYDLRDSNQTIHDIAKDKDVLDEFLEESLENKELVLDKMVEDSKLTKEEAKDILEKIKTNYENGEFNMGQGFGYGLNMGQYNGRKDGTGEGKGFGKNSKQRGNQNNECPYGNENQRQRRNQNK
ncbi:hypothetical protein WG909_09460 [Peptostreptococcaceae bacterium AGR-M142]